MHLDDERAVNAWWTITISFAQLQNYCAKIVLLEGRSGVGKSLKADGMKNTTLQQHMTVWLHILLIVVFENLTTLLFDEIISSVNFSFIQVGNQNMIYQQSNLRVFGFFPINSSTLVLHTQPISHNWAQDRFLLSLMKFTRSIRLFIVFI